MKEPTRTKKKSAFVTSAKSPARRRPAVSSNDKPKTNMRNFDDRSAATESSRTTSKESKINTSGESSREFPDAVYIDR